MLFSAGARQGQGEKMFSAPTLTRELENKKIQDKLPSEYVGIKFPIGFSQIRI